MSVLLGQEAEDSQEQIVSSALQRIMERKGESFRLKLVSGGGLAGTGKKVSVGAMPIEETPLLTAEVFAEIKKSLVLSKKKQKSYAVFS